MVYVEGETSCVMGGGPIQGMPAGAFRDERGVLDDEAGFGKPRVVARRVSMALPHGLGAA